MSQKLTVLGLLSVLIAVTLLIAFASPAITSPFSTEQIETGGTVETGAQPRNLALQAEALKLSRRIGGERFHSKTPPALIIYGVLSTGADRQDVQMVRYPNEKGERVEIAVGSRGRLLSWDAGSGARSSTGVLNLNERAMMERLIFDSADEFILAQLRGASYQVVVRNLRPENAGDNYSGPLWDVVRIDDPETDEAKQALSKWRLYYLNRTTGLLDKVVSEFQGQRIEATLSGWTERAGEKIPSTITWTSQGQTLMNFNLTNISLAAQ